MLPGHRLTLLEGGNMLFPALVDAMDRARQLIQLETYILEFANGALQVVHALERAARRGVTVRLVVDAIGTPAVPKLWLQRFQSSGVQLRIYQPLGKLGLLIPSRWRRLHRKLCVVDGAVGFCGGINLIDDLDDVALGRLEQPRLDFALQVTGPLVAEMQESMDQVWWRLQAARAARQREFRAAWHALREVLPGLEPREPHDIDSKYADTHLRSSASAGLLLRDNLRHRHDIEKAYLKAIGNARKEVVIANAYFIPGRRLRKALVLAVKRGVRVRLLIQGKYERFLQYHAPRPVHQRLLTAGVEIYEYAPSALHAKVAVVDGRWATVGSTNLDPVSLLLGREADVVTSNGEFAGRLRDRLDELMRTHGLALQPQTLRLRPWHVRMRDWAAFAVMRTAIFVTGHRY